MKKYEKLSHLADLKIRAYGKDREEVFRNALFGMSESMRPETTDEEAERDVEIKSIDPEALLVDFLSEALYFSQTNKEAYFEAEFKEFSDKEIKARLKGKKVKVFGEDIKAVTHHDLKLEEKGGTWEAEILFDI